MIEIERTLVCSTANLPKEVIEALCATYACLDYGEGILVPTTEGIFTYSNLVVILNYAREAQGCDWVRFDRDGPLLDGGFPTWDW